MIQSLGGLVLQMVGFAVIMSWLWSRQYKSFTGNAALVLGIIGGLMLYDGFSLAVREESRSRYGKVCTRPHRRPLDNER